LQIGGDFDVQMWTHMWTSQSGKLVQPDEAICIYEYTHLYSWSMQ